MSDQNEKIGINFVVSLQLKNQLQSVANSQGRSMSELIRTILTNYINNTINNASSEIDLNKNNFPLISVYDNLGRIILKTNISEKYLSVGQAVISEDEYMKLKSENKI